MRPSARTLLGLLVGACLLPAPASAQDTTTSRDSTRKTAVELSPLTVVGRIDNLIGTAGSASEGHVGAEDLRQRPLLREGELLETVPGVIVTQHSGDGKANQYFVRGFNLDHGTDFRTEVEGMPVNMPTHAHGQGYTDVNFLIPELVDYIDYRLGVYHAEVGDFGSAGGAQFRLAKTLARPFVTTSAGEHALERAAAGGSWKLGGGHLLLGGEAKRYDGPWRLDEDLRKVSGMARYSWERGASSFSVLGLAYHNRWNSSDQIPLRAVDEALITRFGHIDGSDGGHTQRYSVSGSWRHLGGNSVQDVEVYGIYSDLDLFSNFSYFLSDTVNGDQFNQHEQRTVLGANLRHTQPVSAMGRSHVFTLGLQSRADFINGLGLFLTRRRERLSTVRQDDVRETGSGVYLQAESRWAANFRSELGVRADLYTFHVESDLAANSGSRSAAIVSPKASFIYAPSPAAEVYVSGGLGFHSNDARGTTIRVDPATGDPASRVNPLVRSRGAELGLRLTPVPQWRSTLAIWALDLNSELLFVGDGGATEPTDASHRGGITWANFYRPIPQLSLDLDVSLARARLTGVPAEQDRIPGALENVVAAGVTWAAVRRGPFAALRVRHFGSYPLIEDNSVRASSTTLLNADAGFLVSGIRVTASVLNLLDSKASDIQYYYASRLPGEPAAGVDDVHFHPVEPRQVRLTLAWGL
ncbi:MAG TPA: TonB-dependent receptor [Gemmatimonadales bacterium]|nr:TonB-dependent receptor [Gemmatimonadales bacterium]